MKLHRIIARRIRDDHARIVRHVDSLSRSLEGKPKPGERLVLRDTLNLLRAECHALLATLDELGSWELAMDMEGIKREVAAEDAAQAERDAVREECLAAFESVPAPILGAPLFDHMNAAIAATTDQGEPCDGRR